MNLSDFGERFRGYSGITHLMDDLSEGLAQPEVIMLGGGNPADIPEVRAVLENVLVKLQQSGRLIETLANYDGPQGNSGFLETLADFFRRQYGWNITSRNIALTHGSQSSFFILFNSFNHYIDFCSSLILFFFLGLKYLEIHLLELYPSTFL